MSIISDWMREHRITEVECITPDFTGIARGKIIPKEKFKPWMYLPYVFAIS